MKSTDGLQIPTDYTHCFLWCMVVWKLQWHIGLIQAAQPDPPTRAAPASNSAIDRQTNGKYRCCTCCGGGNDKQSPEPTRPDEEVEDQPTRQTTSKGEQTHQILKDTVMNDVIHGNIELHPLLMAIIDTPQFQRLRNIKMMIGTYYVFSGASHNYFEHAIGQGHLAGKIVKRLRKMQPELDVSEVDVLCVEIAALCRQLGVGPFGHLYVELLKLLGNNDWKQEDTSVTVFKHMLQSNEGLQQLFREYGLEERDEKFIEEQIRGVELEDGTYDGRGLEKDFLYQFVGTRQAGLDVGLWDSILRDSYHLQIKTSFDHKRFIKFLRINTTSETGKRRISLRDKELDTIISLCNTKLMQHRNAKDHKVAAAVERMIIEALEIADGHLRKSGQNSMKFNLSTAHQDMVAFSKLDDSLFHQILHSRNPALAGAKQLLEKIESRDLYRFVDMRKLPPGSEVRDTNLKDRISEGFRQNEQIPDKTVVHLHISSFSFGRSRNLADDLSLYAKESRDVARRQSVNEEARTIKLNQTSEYILRIYSRSREEETVTNIREAFDRIWQDIDLQTQDVHNVIEPSSGDDVDTC